MTRQEEATRVRFVIELAHVDGQASGWVERDGQPAAPFSSWLELLSLLEPPAPRPGARRELWRTRVHDALSW